MHDVAFCPVTLTDSLNTGQGGWFQWRCRVADNAHRHILLPALAGSIGRRMACSSAVLGLYFSISESYLTDLADGRVPDDLCTMAAGGFRGCVVQQLFLCAFASGCAFAGH